MTPEELLAMPSSDYMCKEQLEYFKSLLEKEKQICQESLVIAIDEATDPENISVTSSDPIDRASGHDALMKSGQYSIRLNKQIRMINAALNKILSGDYGYCDNTGDEIGLRRLMVCPYARFTIDEQEALEQREKHFN